MLAALLLASSSPAQDGPRASLGQHRYVGARKCKTCHGKELMGNQHAVWLKGPHHRAYQTLEGAQAREIAAKRALTRPPHQAPECLVCHVTGYGVSPLLFYKELDPTAGVQCESCHGPGRDFRKKKIMSVREDAIAAGLWDARDDPTICTACHNPRSPTFDHGRYTLPDGKTSGFDFKQALKRIAHPIPEEVKGRYVELEEKLKKEEKARAR